MRPRRPPAALRVGLVFLTLAPPALTGPRVAEAQAFEAVGTRALGMGGAFVAVADDATASYWNPAGLINVFFSALVDVQRVDARVGSDASGRTTSEELTTFASMATSSFGLSYYRLRAWQVGRSAGTAPLRSLVTQHLGAAVVQPIAPGVTLATVIKVVRGTLAAGVGDGAAGVGALVDLAAGLDGRTTNRFDLDAGLLVGPGRWQIGLVARNLRQPEFVAADDLVVRLDRQVRVGASLRPTASLVVAVDADLTTSETVAGSRRVVAAGAEQQLGRLRVRGGGRLNLEAETPELVGSVGLSLELLETLWLDGQATGGRDDGDRGWGISTRLSY